MDNALVFWKLSAALQLGYDVKVTFCPGAYGNPPGYSATVFWGTSTVGAASAETLQECINDAADMCRERAERGADQ